jgi:hypothetical protein
MTEDRGQSITSGYAAASISVISLLFPTRESCIRLRPGYGLFGVPGAAINPWWCATSLERQLFNIIARFIRDYSMRI